MKKKLRFDIMFQIDKNNYKNIQITHRVANFFHVWEICQKIIAEK